MQTRQRTGLCRDYSVLRTPCSKTFVMNANSKINSIADKIAAIEATNVANDSTDVESIIKSCLEKGNFKLYKGLKIKSVAATTTLDGATTKTRCTFMLDTKILGMKAEKDSFGIESRIPGMVDNFTISAFSVAGAMRAQGGDAALLARDVANMSANIPADALRGEYPLGSKDNVADIIFMGGEIDVLAEYVNEGECISSPFSKSKSDEPVTSDKVVHYIVGCQLGKYGIKKLEKLL